MKGWVNEVIVSRAVKIDFVLSGLLRSYLARGAKPHESGVVGEGIVSKKLGLVLP